MLSVELKVLLLEVYIVVSLYIRHYALYLMLSILGCICTGVALHEHKESLHIHGSLEEKQTDSIGRDVLCGDRILGEFSQVLLEYVVPVEKLEFVHKHDLRDLLYVLKDGEAEQELSLPRLNRCQIVQCA